MQTLFHPKIATGQIRRLALIVTAIMVIWHFTLLRTHTPYMNSIFSWVTTVICPFLTFMGIHVIAKAYSKSSNVSGTALEGVGWNMWLDFEGAIAAILFIALLPVICFLLPAEVALGIAYKKGWIDLFLEVWNTATLKEGIFIIMKGFFVIFSGSFIVWGILLQIWRLFRRTGKYVMEGKWAQWNDTAAICGCFFV